MFNNNAVSVQGSLSKYIFGSNIYTPTLQDIREAIENICDCLGSGFANMNVTRLDIATVIKTEHKPHLYYQSLGNKPYSERFSSASSLYYKTKSKELVFYDKVEEMKKHKDPIPPEFADSNLMRVELRLKNKPARQLNLSQRAITSKDLCTEEVYNKAIQELKSEFDAITKLNRATMTQQETRHTVAIFRDLFLARAVQASNSQDDIEQFIDELKENNTFPDRKYYTRLKHDLYEYFKIPTGKGSGYIEEIESKISDAESKARLSI